MFANAGCPPIQDSANDCYVPGAKGTASGQEID